MRNFIKDKCSCLMLTYISYERMENALCCFLKQTYPKKELIIVANGSETYTEQIREIVSSHNADDCVKIYEIRNNFGTIADMRNLAVWFCNGEFICIWDDDDIYGDRRIEMQIESLNKNRDKFYSIFGNCTYHLDGYSEKVLTNICPKGSILFRNKQKNDEVFMGEDDEYQKFQKKDGIVLKNNPKDYIFVKHKLNVRSDSYFHELVRNNESIVEKFKKKNSYEEN